LGIEKTIFQLVLKSQLPDINLAISSPFIFFAKLENIVGAISGYLSITRIKILSKNKSILE
jgi:hypothetical protein